VTVYEPVLLRNRSVPNSIDIGVYESRGGYAAARKALTEMQPARIVDLVKASGLRGRGGAGFPTGVKWGFVPKGDMLKYLVCNCDEAEPGTFNNRELVETDPHQLLEGMIIAAYATGCTRALIYARGEFAEGAARLSRAIEQARERGYLGPSVFGSAFSLDVYLLRGAGAYICGEETALLESAEGNRPMPRSRPPFPAVVGLYGKPTLVNNVETLSCVPHIVERGAEWFNSIGSAPRNTGPKIYSVSGHVNRPGNYELPLGVTLRELIYEHAGGVPRDRRVKAVVPGGSSAAMLGADKLDIKMDFDTLAAAGSMLGTGAVIVMDETTCIPHAALRMVEFYNHESCGKCTPCREGTLWMVKLLRRICTGEGTLADLDRLLGVAQTIGFGAPNITLCALGDASTSPITSGIRLFGDEFEYHVRHGLCPTEKQWPTATHGQHRRGDVPDLLTNMPSYMLRDEIMHVVPGASRERQ
jgi:NADH-quinone oxidoreductase subunit F